jgi:hypothetical protein
MATNKIGYFTFEQLPASCRMRRLKLQEFVCLTNNAPEQKYHQGSVNGK